MNIQISEITTNLVECLRGLNSLNESMYRIVSCMYGYKNEKTGERDGYEDNPKFKEFEEAISEAEQAYRAVILNQIKDNIEEESYFSNIEKI